MATTSSATEIWLIGSPKSELNTSCLPTNDELVLRYFFHIFKYCNSKILQSKTPTQVAERKGLSITHYFFVVASMIDASSGNREDFVFSLCTRKRARSSNRKAISSQITQHFVSPQ